MLIPGSMINVFDKSKTTTQGSWFTGKMNTQVLDFDPLVTGYAFIVWTKLPFWVEKTYENFSDMTQKNFKSFQGLTNLDLQTQQYIHTFNGNGYEYASSIQKQNTNFTMIHQEFSGSPIKNMYQFWVTGIRDPETDIAVYPRAFGCAYGAKNHTGELLYIVTRPDANNVQHHNIEFSAYYTAVMPTTVPISHFSYSQGEHSSAELEINFVGDLHLGPEVDNFAAKALQDSEQLNGQIFAKPYPILTTADFDPSNRGEYEALKGGNASLKSYATGGWEKQSGGINITAPANEYLAPAKPPGATGGGGPTI